jgi:hypothetical protein
VEDKIEIFERVEAGVVSEIKLANMTVLPFAL